MSRTIHWWLPQLTGEELPLVQEVLESNFLNEGEFTTRFERAIAQRLGAKHAVAVTSGTTALFLALAGIGVRSGDEVIVPDLTFIATANAVTLAGAAPVLVDIDPRTLTIDPASIERAVTARTKAVIPVHVSGRAADMDAILDVARRHGLVVIEDAAEAFMSRVDGRYLGTLGKAGCLSFSPNKTITTGQGGAIVTDDDALAWRLRELKDQGRRTRGTGGDDLHPSVGYNFKLTNLQAAVGLAQLSCLDVRLERQRRIYQGYARELRSLPGLSLLGFRIETGECPLWTDALVDRRDELDRYLQQRDIHCRRFWLPLHTQDPYRRPEGAFPNAMRVSRRALWLPSAFTLSDDDVRDVSEHIRRYLVE